MKVLRSIKAILAVPLAMLILAFSMGLSISQHFCQGSLKASALFSDAAGCGMDPGHDVVKEHSIPSFSEAPCCDEQLVTVTIKDSTTLLKAKSEQTLPALISLMAFASLFLFHPAVSTGHDSWLAGYSPPLIERDIPVFIQSFLI